MCNRNWIYALPLTILFALQATSSYAQEAIGKATSVIPQATGSHAGALSSGSSVYSKETIRTGQSGQADLQFKDNSNLKVGSNSSVHLDKFVYDRTNRLVLSPSKQRVARFVLWQDHKVVAPCRSRPLMAPLACVVEVASPP